MNRRKVLIVGALGMKDAQIGGQTDKVRLLSKELEKRLRNYEVEIFDTSYWRKNPLILFLKFRFRFNSSSEVILMPAKNGLRLIPMVLRWRKSSQRINYVVIGGWLPELLEKDSALLEHCKKLDKIVVETVEMQERMQRLGLRNVVNIPNFKCFDSSPSKTHGSDNILRIVFFSRVSRKKGIELLIKAISELNTEMPNSIRLDIVGPIEKGYEEDFRRIVCENSSCVTYVGFFSSFSVEIHRELSKYDLMVFPTLHQTEGFPGVIIDAYAAGLPVIASSWDSAYSIVRDQVTGRVFELGNLSDLKNKIREFIDLRGRIDIMKENCLIEAKKYHVDCVIPSLIDFLELDKT